MVGTCFDHVIDQLSEMQQYQSSEVEGWFTQYGGSEIECWKRKLSMIEPWKRELRFLKMILWCFEAWDYSDSKMIAKLRSMSTRVDGLWKSSRPWTLIHFSRLKVHQSSNFTSNEAAALERKIHQSKLLIVEISEGNLLFSLWKLKSCNKVQILQFLDLVLQNLKDLLAYKANEMVPFLKQIETLQEKLIFLHDFFELAIHGSTDCKEAEDFKICLYTFANRAAYWAFLYWVKGTDEETTTKLNILLSDMLQGLIKPCVPDVWGLYIGALKSIKLQKSYHTLLLGRTVSYFIDLLLGNHGMICSTNPWQNVRDGLIFLLTFMADPPKRSNQQLSLICNSIDVLLKKCSSLNVYLDDMTVDSAKQYVVVCDFARMIRMVMDKISQMYVHTSLDFYNFPRTNGLGFFDFLLQNIERLKMKINNDVTFMSFAKNFIIQIEEELSSLRPFLNGIFLLPKGREEFQETRLQVISLAYRIEHVISACQVLLHPIWYHMACLSDILEQIKAAKRNLENVDTYKIDNIGVSPSMRSVSRPLGRASYLLNNDEVIGLKKEANSIIDELVWGSKSLCIISIIGMGGLGKTTLAKKIYDSSLVKSHFHEFAFCYVSQVHNKRRLLRDVLSGINGNKDDFNEMSEDDLAHEVWKCLSGKRYLIVLDDIWDIRAWDEVKESFPKEQIGSRIIFTTRSHIVALEAKSSPHTLGFLSEDDSFELLQRKAFGKDGFPPNFVKVGKTISTNCKGLPLALVIVAGLLASVTPSLSWLNEIAQATSCFFEEGCRDVIRLSYKNLPENLKACFLYLSITKEDEVISAKTLELLWMAEGFVDKDGTKSLRRVAKEYMSDLVYRNLVTAVDMTCGGGIKTCRLHDLVHDFCRRQAQEDKFIWLTDGNEASSSSRSKLHRYRVCYENYQRSVEDKAASNVHSMLCVGLPPINKQGQFLNFRGLKCVQVLHLQFCPVDSFSNKFQLVDLLNLRYLWVGDANISPWVVPESICNLWNLETFIWKGDGGDPIKLPKTIWKMKRLRHLEFRSCELEVGDDHMEEGRHQLDNMESFSRLSVSDHGTAREVLRRLPNIQKLDLWLEFSQWTNQLLEIDFLARLESLELWILQGTGQLVRFPSTLRRLELWDLTSADLLSAIGELPCLEILKLTGDWKQWVVEGNKFQKLKYLELEAHDLKEWNADDDSFPCLEKLELRFCQHFEIPGFFGELAALERIAAHYCSCKVVSAAMRIHEEQVDSGKMFHLEIC